MNRLRIFLCLFGIAASSIAAAAARAEPPRNPPPRPSAGCGRPQPRAGARTLTAGGRKARFIVRLPRGYDPATPVPLGFAFHGHGLDEKTCAAGPECPGFRDLPAITVYPKSLGPGWEDSPEPLASNIKVFQALLTLMKEEACVDENRIFVAGVSSGGQFVEHLACRFGAELRLVAPIAAYVDKGVDAGCTGTPAQIVIHGITDELEKHAHPVRDLYAHRNACSAPPPQLAEAEARMKAAFATKSGKGRSKSEKDKVACVDYPDCTHSPLRYCVFSEITYDGLTHGWPSMGGRLIGEFLRALDP